MRVAARLEKWLMGVSRTSRWVTLILLGLLASCIAPAQTGSGWVFGSVLDPSGLPVAGASIAIDSAQGTHLTAATGRDGTFSLHLPASGKYTVRVKAAGFAPVIRPMQLSVGTANPVLRLQEATAANQDIVSAYMRVLNTNMWAISFWTLETPTTPNSTRQSRWAKR
jgi:hypothetical protein